MSTEEQTEFGEFAPYDVNVEQSVLSTLLQFDDTVAVVSAILEPADFYDPLHSRIFEKMLVLDELERPITVRTLFAIMKNDPGLSDLKKAAGNKWDERDNYLEVLADVVRPVPALDELRDLCQTLAALAIRREALGALLDANDRLSRGSKIETALAQVVRVADQVALAEVHRIQSPDLGVAVEAMNREMDAGGTLNRGLMLDLDPLDKLLGGLLPESLIIGAGRPGMGKSIFGTNCLSRAALIRDADDQPVWMPTGFSLEMSQAENAARIIAELDFRQCLKEGRDDPIHYSNVRKNRLSNDQFTRWVLWCGELKALGIHVYDQAKLTMQKIRALARARQAMFPERKILAVIDHIQLVKASDRYRGNRIDELTEITGLCKELAKSLKAPVIALSQLSRGVESREDKRPLLSDLRESGSIEQDADVVLMFYRPEYYLRTALRHAEASPGKAELAIKLQNQLEAAKGRFEIGVEKNRHGSVGNANLWIDVASGVIRAQAPSMDDDPQGSLLNQPLDGLDDLQKRTGTA